MDQFTKDSVTQDFENITPSIGNITLSDIDLYLQENSSDRVFQDLPTTQGTINFDLSLHCDVDNPHNRSSSNNESLLSPFSDSSYSSQSNLSFNINPQQFGIFSQSSRISQIPQSRHLSPEKSLLSPPLSDWRTSVQRSVSHNETTDSASTSSCKSPYELNFDYSLSPLQGSVSEPEHNNSYSALEPFPFTQALSEPNLPKLREDSVTNVKPKIKRANRLKKSDYVKMSEETRKERAQQLERERAKKYRDREREKEKKLEKEIEMQKEVKESLASEYSKLHDQIKAYQRYLQSCNCVKSKHSPVN